MMNGFTHGSQGLQTRSNQAEFLGVGTVSDRQNLMLRGLAAVETQQGNAFDYNSGLTRSADRSDVAEAPVGFDFLGGHPQLIRSQHPGISQSHPRQQPGYNDMHLLQQQLVYRQLQEIQRQQQLQQLGQGAMQQNQFSQLSGTEKQVAGVQLPTMLSGMPIHSTSNRMWSNELMGGDPKTPTSSQILVAGNMNWIQGSGSSSMHGFPNGLMYSHDHGQAMRSMGTVPQQIDQSLYGTPIINARGSLNYSQFPGISCESTVTKADSKRAEKPDAFNFRNEDFQGKTLFGNSPVQNVNDGVPSGSFQQANLLSQSVQAQEFQDRQEQPNWLSSTQQKSEQQEGLSHCVTNLDATEEKLLFSTDDDSSWNGNTSMVGHLHGTPLEGNDYFSGFPSIQSGSWSALMQEALGASSSDTVVQEEWGGLSVEKTALPTGNHSAEFDGNDKQHMAWDDKNTRSASSLTSRAFPLFDDGDKGLNCPSAHNFEKSTKFACEQDFGVQHESFQEPAVETNKKQLDQSDQEKQFRGSSLQAQMPFANFSNGVWTEQMRQQSIKSAADMEFSLQNVQGIWARQQKMPLQNIDSHPSSKPNSWNINETLPPSGLNSLKVHDNNVKIVNAQRNDVKRITHLERDFNPAVTNSDAQRINQQMVSGRQDDFGKQVAIDSSVTRKGDQGPGGVAQPFDSSLNIREKRSCEMYGSKEENSHQKKVMNEGYTYDCSNASQHTDSGSSASKNSLVAGNGPHASVSGQKLSGQPGRKTLGPRKFQHHPMGNVEINVESASSQSHTSHSQGSPQLFVHGLNTHEQGYVGRSQFVVGHGVANNASDMGKRHLTELQKDAGGTVERPSVGVIRSRDHALSACFDGSNPQHDQNRRVGQSSQNMLELLHKVDQSRDSNTHPQFGYSDGTMRSLATEVDPSDEAGSHLQLDQSSSQGVGLGLAPPARAQPGSNPALPVHNSLQTADESGSRHADSEAGQKDRTFSLPLAHEVSQREDPNNVKSMSGQAHREASQPNIQGNYSLAASTLSYARNQQHQQQQQQAAHATGVVMMSQSANLSFGSRLNANEHVKQSSHVRQTHEAHGGAVSQALSSGVSGRVFPSRLASATSDNQAPVASQFYSLNVGLSRPINSIASHLRNTGKQLPLVEPRSVQSSTLSGTSQQQGAFSTMQQNTWTAMLAQRPFSGVHTQKTPPNLLHPMNQLSSSRITSPWFPQKTDDQSNRGKTVAPSELVTSPASSGQVTGGEEIGVEDNSLQQLPPEGVDIASKTSDTSQGQKLLPKQLSDGNSVGSIPSLVHLHQQEHNGRRHPQDSSLDSQREHASLPNGPSSNHDTGAYGNDSKQSDVRMQNYSLLQQMQAMKGADSDLSKRVGKRLRGADSGNDASQMDWKTGQRYIYAQNTVFGHPGDGQLGASSQQSPFPSGVKMLSFSSTENEENSSNTSPQLTGKPIPSQSLLASTEHDLQNHIHSFGTTLTSTSREGNEQPQISPHTAPTWFKQYGTYNDGQIRSMYDGFGSSQPITKAAAQNYFFVKASENRVSNVTDEQRNDASLVGSIWQSTSSLVAATNSSHHGVPLDVTDNNTILRLKKRKSLTYELLPWHKEVAHGSRKLQNISMAEMEWSRAANRLVEKVEEEFEMTEDGPALPRPRRRLIFTTQLMQQLFPSVPARILRANASTSYESVTYFVAKFALGDACSLMCCSGSDSHVHNDSENMVSERIKSPEKVEDHIFSKIVENFVGRARKLENDLLRLDKRVSILDLRMECQDLERCSIINRFAKFHGRAQTDGVESSSTFEYVHRRLFPQRQAVAVPMPRNLPEGVLCLSL